MPSRKIAIKVDHLSKQYRLGGPQEQYHTIRDAIVNSIRAPMNVFCKKPHEEGFWALKEVSFEVEQGEVVGIIGRNGAGKSTLLKILSRITTPTEGTVELHGRVGSLLEVGTGFHPELTGRENIYLSGSILGMKRKEIDAKLDDIVKFSEIEKFLDTPVKRYSSGMYVRLAFAVAAHLEPEILLVDEVLAVGDAAFQKKCLGKMGDVAKEGRTVLFVSHNMNAVEQLCKSCILLENGSIYKAGTDVRSIISSYLFNESGNDKKTYWVNDGHEYSNPIFKPLKFLLTDHEGKSHNNTISNSEDVWLSITGEIQDFDIALQIGFALYGSEGQLLFWSCHNDTKESDWPILRRGINVLKCKIPKHLLNQGSYRLELIVALYYRYWICEPGTNAPSINFDIQGGLSDSPYWLVKRPGLLAPVLDWDCL